MTKLMDEVLAELATLPQHAQEELARQWLADVDDWKWDDSFARSPHVLERLAAEALAEDEAGETVPLEEVLNELDEIAHHEELSQEAEEPAASGSASSANGVSSVAEKSLG